MNARSLAKALFVVALFIEAGSAHAATFEVSGWLPYWRKATSTTDALQHINQFTEINPFGYSVKSDGTLADTAQLGQDPWTSLIASARDKKIRVIPTVMWSDGAAMQLVLSNQASRIALEDAITAIAVQNNFDGIDIDFEGKRAETGPYFSTFLKGLYKRMGKKWVMCTIEARTPISSRYDGTPPGDAGVYSNDYVQINKYCDRVRIMAYDQGTVDVKLNKTANQEPYVPVADVRWVEKAIREALKVIPKSKLVIGVPTYGYEYQVTPLSESGYRYDLLWAFNQKYAFDLISQYQVNVKRNAAGEMSFSYIPAGAVTMEATNSPQLTNNTAITLGAVNQNVVVEASASIAPPLTAFNIVWWSDAKAIQDKIALAKKLGVRGIAIFKIDGGEDPALWDILPKVR